MKTISKLIILIFTPASIFAQARERAILMKSFWGLKSKPSISYQAGIRFKYLDRDDTLRLSGKVFLQRQQKDTVFHGKIWLATSDSFYKFYDLRKIYKV